MVIFCYYFNYCHNAGTELFGFGIQITVCKKCKVFLQRGTHPSQTGSTMPPPRRQYAAIHSKPKTRVARLIYEPAFGGYSLNFTYDEGLVDFLKKAIPSHKREYDRDTRTWSFSSEFFDVVRLLFDAHRDYTLTIVSEAEVLKKIQEQEEASRHNWTPQAHSIDQELQKFFVLVSKAHKIWNFETDLSFEQLKNWSKGEATKAYRRCASLLHPDKQGGDATKMSELNAVWQVLKESYYIK